MAWTRMLRANRQISANNMTRSLHGVDRAGRYQLTNAMIDQDAIMVARLLSKGANPNSVDHAGRSPLHFAAQNNDAAMGRTILQNGASFSLRDAHGNTALSTAVFSYQGTWDALRFRVASLTA